jgi:hypothetical protein
MAFHGADDGILSCRYNRYGQQHEGIQGKSHPAIFSISARSPSIRYTQGILACRLFQTFDSGVRNPFSSIVLSATEKGEPARLARIGVTLVQ